MMCRSKASNCRGGWLSATSRRSGALEPRHTVTDDPLESRQSLVVFHEGVGVIDLGSGKVAARVEQVTQASRIDLDRTM